MPPRLATRGRPVVQLGPSAARGDTTLPTEDPVALALNRMAEVIEHVTGNTHREENRPDNKEDRALERFLTFFPPKYLGKQILHRKWKIGLIRWKTSLLC
jgi:hypothetical protein